jgi:serine/threonine-protein kinase RsbW
MASIQFQSRLSEVPRVHAEIVDHAMAEGFTDEALFAIRLTVEEALVNAVRHGNGLDETRVVDVEWTIDDRRFVITITDCGCGFDPADLPDPTAVENLSRPSGRGVMLMKCYMDEVSYNTDGNAVTLTKFKGSKKPVTEVDVR